MISKTLSLVIASLAVLLSASLARAQSSLPPVILSQPQNITAASGATVSFSVGVSNATYAPFFYQWQFNGTNLLNGGSANYPANGPTLTLYRITNSSAGSYDVVITNAYGATTSSVATLTIALPPTLTSQPASLVVSNATNVVFSVGATGTGPLTYQWLFNGQIITNNIITTVAGGSNNVTAGPVFSGDGGPATSASLDQPAGVALDSAGNLFIADKDNGRIRKVNPAGIITTVAGDGANSYNGNGQVATNSGLYYPSGVAVDADDNLFIADTYNQRIRTEIYGFLITVAGNGQTTFSGDGGSALNAGLDFPAGVAVDANGNIYIADTGHSRVRKVDLNDNITTVAGTSSQGYNGDGQAATNAWLSQPAGVSVDAQGNLYIADTGNSRIRKVGANGIITTVAGAAYQGYNGDGLAATNAWLDRPAGVSVDAYGQIYIADTANGRIRKVGLNGVISTVAGTSTSKSLGDGGAATNAFLDEPAGVTVDARGNIYIADTLDNRVRKVTPQGPVLPVTVGGVTNGGNYQVIVSSAWGSVTSSVAALTVDLPPAIIRQPANQTIVIGGSGSFNATVASPGPVNYRWQFNGTNLGVSGFLTQVFSVTLPLNQVTTNNAGSYQVIFTNAFGSVTSSVATLTLAFPPTFTAEPASQTVVNGSTATFDFGVTGTGPFTYQWLLNGTNLPGPIITTAAGDQALQGAFSGDGGPATNAGLYSTYGVAAGPDGSLYIADTDNQRVRKVDTNGLITTIAGNGVAAYAGDGGAATNASLYQPNQVAADLYGNVFIVDTYNQRIRKVDTNGIITTVAGNGGIGYAGDGTAATNTSLYYPDGLAVDAQGELFIADTSDLRIRKVDTNGIITTLASGLGYPGGVAVDAGGNVFIADTDNGVVRRLATNGVLTIVAGNGGRGYAGDGGAATNASLYYPQGLALDAAGNLYIADWDNQRVRRVDTNGFITTVAGSGGLGYSGDGGSALSATLGYPSAVALNPAGNLFIADSLNSVIREVNLAAGYPVQLFTNLTTPYGGNYQVIVSSPWGSVTSSIATMTIVFPPAITNQPVAQTVINGGNAAFSVTATGTAPLAYQWQFNGVNLTDEGEFSGTATTNLVVTAATTNDAGLYDVIVSNAWGSVTSSVVALSIAFPPTITNQPVAQTIINGSNALFSVTATGTAPLAYQWQFNGVNLTDEGEFSGSATANLAVTGATTNDAGWYDVIVANTWGSVTSSVVALSIVFPPAITNQPVAQTIINGGNVAFNVAATGTAPLSYQWQFNGVNLTDGAEFSGSATTNLVITAASASDAGGYDVVVANAWGSVTSSIVALTIAYPPAITNQPASQTVVNQKNATFNVTATGTAPFSYQWQFNGINLRDGAYLSGSATAALVVKQATATNAGGYDVIITSAWGSVTSSVAALTIVYTPGIISPPASLDVLNGSNASFSVSASGTAPLSYQWQFKGVNLTDGGGISGSATTNLLVTQATTNNAGNYAVIITNAWGSITSSVAALTIVYAPVITIQPVSTNAILRQNPGFSVGATGTAPLSYRWLFNGLTITNGDARNVNTASMYLDSVATNNAGSYAVVISNAWGSVTSSVVTLTIIYPPVITSQPVSLIATNGKLVSFSVGVSGTGPFTYQWVYSNKYFFPYNSIQTVAGGSNSGFGGDGGPATNAWLYAPRGVAVDADGNLFIADDINERIRKVNAGGIISTLAGNGRSGYNGNGLAATNSELDLATQFPIPAGIAVDADDNVFIADTFNNRVRVETYGIVITVAGSGAYGYGGDGGAAYNAGLNEPSGVAVDADGNLYIADCYNNRIRKVDLNDNITTVAGNGTNRFSGDGGPAVNASLNFPNGVTVDASGNLFIADTENARIRKVDTNGIITTVAGGNSSGALGDGGAATNAYLQSPAEAVADAYGNLFIADSYHHRIRKVSSNGIITTVAGNGTPGYSGDGGAATNAWLNYPSAVAVDAYGNLFIADTSNNRIREVTTSGPVLTINASLTNGGNYQVIVTGVGGSVTSSVAVLTVGVAPVVTIPPVSQNVAVGGTASFSETATGTAPLAYQWLFNGTNLAGRTAYGFNLTSVTPANAGSYQVVVTNLFGSVTSSAVILAVGYPPTITQQPAGLQVIAGGSAAMSLVVTGTPPLTLQWSVNYANLVGQTNSLLTLNAVSPANAGQYQVYVTNLFGWTLSGAATLTVAPPQISSSAATNGTVTLNLLTAANTSSELLAATNLTPPVVWQSLYTNVTGTNGVWQFTDTNASQYPVRFYRTSTP
jgi:sugar lactone lactonase YvrE